MENEVVKEQGKRVEVFSYESTKTPEVEKENIIESEVLDTLGVRHRDVVISICGNPDGALFGRTKAEALKYCADILLVSAGENGLEDNLEIVLALQETLQFDYGWKPIKVFEFLRKWKRNLYLKQIGEENRTEENIEEMNKAIGIMNKSKKKTAIGDKIEESMEEPENVETSEEEVLEEVLEEVSSQVLEENELEMDSAEITAPEEELLVKEIQPTETLEKKLDNKRKKK